MPTTNERTTSFVDSEEPIHAEARAAAGCDDFGDPSYLTGFRVLMRAYDTEAKSIAGTGFPMEEVSDAIRRTYARAIVSFIDACHSAGVSGDIGLRAINNPINAAFLGRAEHSLGVQVTFTASQVNQYSQEGAQWGGGHGVFTYITGHNPREYAPQVCGQFVYRHFFTNIQCSH